MKLYEIDKLIEEIAPKETAQEWDNVGILVGDKNNEVSKVLVALDLNSLVVDEAVSNGVDLIVTHHPYIFKPLMTINDPNLSKLIKNNISVYAAHTNLDISDVGVNKIFADLLGMQNLHMQEMMFMGEISEKAEHDFVNFVKQCLCIQSLRATTLKETKSIKKVAVLGGSGGDFTEIAINNGCDAYITGEAAYHHAQYAYENNLLLIEAGHFETENPVVEFLAGYIREKTNLEVKTAEPMNIYKIK